MNWFLFRRLFLLNCVLLFSHAIDTLKNSRLEQSLGVKYLTYTKVNPNASVNIRDVSFNDGYNSVFVIHGFECKSLEKPLQVKDDIFQHNMNAGRVIIVS